MKRFFVAFVSAAIAGTIMAKPAYRGAIQLTQGDGSSITVHQQGDEFFHFYTDKEGNTLELNEKGMYVKRAAYSNEEIQAKRKAAKIYKDHMVNRKPADIGPNEPHPEKGVVILVNFSNKTFKTDSTHWKNALGAEGWTNSTYGAVGSAHDYFKACSNGQYNLDIDVWGPYTLSNTSSYYGGSDGTANATEMIQQACSLAYADGRSFKDYASDGTNVDFVYVVFAGYDMASGAKNTVWAHSYNLSYDSSIKKADRTFGGYVVDLYACGGELVGTSGSQPDGIGTFCHEFSHVLGMPDYYDTAYGTNDGKTVGAWSLMDYGCYNGKNSNGFVPPLYSAYDKYYMGWLTPTLLNEAQEVTMEPWETTGNSKSYVISTNGAMPAVTYTDWTWYLENRQQTGWDKYLPGHGLIVTKVKYNATKWSGNTLNNASTMLYDIIEAGGKNDSEGNDSDPYPGTKELTNFSTVGDYNVVDIREMSSNISFSFMPKSINDNENIDIFTVLGQKVISIQQEEIGQLAMGIYVIRSTNETKKIAIIKK